MKRNFYFIAQLLILLGITLSARFETFAQNTITNQDNSIKLGDTSPKMIGLADALKLCKLKYGVDIWYVNKMVDGLTVSSEYIDTKENVEVVLGRLLVAVGLKFKKIKSNIIKAYLLKRREKKCLKTKN